MNRMDSFPIILLKRLPIQNLQFAILFMFELINKKKRRELVFYALFLSSSRARIAPTTIIATIMPMIAGTK
jgi:hypothetical protein